MNAWFLTVSVPLKLLVQWYAAAQSQKAVSDDFTSKQILSLQSSVERLGHTHMQKTVGIHPMLFQCWPTVFDAAPTLKQDWVNTRRLVGIQLQLWYSRG